MFFLTLKLKWCGDKLSGDGHGVGERKRRFEIAQQDATAGRGDSECEGSECSYSLVSHNFWRKKNPAECASAQCCVADLQINAREMARLEEQVEQTRSNCENSKRDAQRCKGRLEDAKKNLADTKAQ